MNSAHNNTTTLLASSSTFTGLFEGLHDFHKVDIQVDTDQNGTLFVDSKNIFGSVLTSQYNITADVVFHKKVSIKGTTFRVRFTNNSGSTQTRMKLLSHLNSRTETDNNVEDKLDTINTSVQSLVNYGGAGNNSSLGDGSVRLQTYCYGHDASNGQMRSMKVNSTGVVSVDDATSQGKLDTLGTKLDSIITNTSTIDVNTDGLETKVDTTNTKLDSLINYGGAGNNSIGDGSVRLQTFCLGHDSSGGQMRVLKVNGTGVLSVDDTTSQGKLDTLATKLDLINSNLDEVDLNTDTLEAKADTTNTTLSGIATQTGTSRASHTPFSAVSVSAGATSTSSSIDLDTYKVVNVYGNDSDTSFSNNFDMEVSDDDTTFFKNSSFTSSPLTNGDYLYETDRLATRYIRFVYTNNDSSSHTITTKVSLRKS